MFSSSTGQPQTLPHRDIESEEALEAAKECLNSYSLQVLLACKFHKTPEEIERELWNTVTLYSVTQTDSPEEATGAMTQQGPQWKENVSHLESASIYSEGNHSRNERVPDEDRANAASHLFHVLKSLQFRKFPSERVVAKVRKISD